MRKVGTVLAALVGAGLVMMVVVVPSASAAQYQGTVVPLDTCGPPFPCE